MDDQTVLWIVIGVVVVLAIVGIALWWSRSGRRDDLRRREAERLREKAAAERIELQRREAEAARIDAEARMAQAEADARAAEAAGLQAEARSRADDLEAPRSRVEDRLRRADHLDPDVDLDRRDGMPPDGTPETTPRDAAGRTTDMPGDGR